MTPERAPGTGATRSFLATVVASFEMAPGRAADIADALMLVPEVSTVRVEDDGRSTVYRADLLAASPSEALPTAAEAAAHVAEVLHVRFRMLSIAIEQSDEAVPYTGRGIVLERRYP